MAAFRDIHSSPLVTLLNGSGSGPATEDKAVYLHHFKDFRRCRAEIVLLIKTVSVVVARNLPQCPFLLLRQAFGGVYKWYLPGPLGQRLKSGTDRFKVDSCRWYPSCIL